MKIKLIFISAIYVILSISCQSNGSNQEVTTDSIAIVNNTASQSDLLDDNPDELIIKGKDIWVRDIPETGNVLTKLNEGDKCKILTKGKLAVIKGRPDYWYQIEFNKMQGWVFGSQTNVMLFKPVLKPFTGNLTVCYDPLIAEIQTPASLSYSFNPDNSFRFNVAAGFIIDGVVEWEANHIKLNNLELIMDTPDGNTKTELKGSITFAIFVKEQLICMSEIENRLADKSYSPVAGCFCLGN